MHNPHLSNADMVIRRMKSLRRGSRPVESAQFANLNNHLRTLHLLAAEGMLEVFDGKSTERGWLLTPDFEALFPPLPPLGSRFVKAKASFNPPTFKWGEGLSLLLEFMAPDIRKRVEASEKCYDWLNGGNANREESKWQERRTRLGAFGTMNWTEYTLSDSEKATMLIAT